MKRADFQPAAPGRLEPTTFLEHQVVDGLLQTTHVQGFGFVPNLLPQADAPPPDYLVDLFPAILDAERSLSQLEGAASRLPNPHMLINAFSRREALLSSAIENTFSSAEQLALFAIDPNITDDRNQTREVYNYACALEYGLASELPICLRLIKEMHAILLTGIQHDGAQPGEFRVTQNAIGHANQPFSHARYVPPPPRFLDELLNNFEHYLHHRNPTLPRLVQFAITHYQFEAIHPFLDGNGRLGRLLITLMLCRQGQLSKPLVYVSGFFEANRPAYYDLLLSVSRAGTWQDWIRFFLTAVNLQAKDALERADQLIALQTRFQNQVRQKQASALLPGLIDYLFLNPAVSIKRVKDHLKCSHGTATNLVKRLTDLNILVEATGRDYGKIFVCRPILNLIHNPS